MEHAAVTSGAPSSEGGFSCSSVVLRCCKWLEGTWLGQQAIILDDFVGKTCLYRTLMALLCLQPPIDLLTDFQQIWFFSSEGWWFSLAVAGTVWYASVRFGFIYAATQARPVPFRRIFVLYMPGLLIPFWDIVTKLDSQVDGARSSSALPGTRHTGVQSTGAPPSAESGDHHVDHDASCEDDIELRAHSPIVDEENPVDEEYAMNDMPLQGEDETKEEEQPCRVESPRLRKIRESPFNGSKVPEKALKVIKAFVFKYGSPRIHYWVSYDDLGLNPLTAPALPILFAVMLVLLPFYFLEALCAKIAGRNHELYSKDAPSAPFVVKFFINFTFELWLVLPAMFLGTYLVVCASVTLARESLMPRSSEDYKKHKQYSRVITFIEGLLESLPQFILQTITYTMAVKSGNTEPFYGISYDTMFTISAALSLVGIFKAAWSFYRNYEAIKKMLVPPTMKDDVLAVVRHDGMALSFADSALKRDKDVVLAAVGQNGLALKYADAEMKRDDAVVLAALQQNEQAFCFADVELKKSEEFVRTALQRNWRALDYADADMKKNKDVVLVAFRQDGRALEFADAERQNDEEVVLIAVQQDGRALKFADARPKQDKTVVVAAVQQHGRALEFADASLKKDQDVVLKALQQDWRALEFVDADRKRDTEVIRAVLQQHGKARGPADAKLKKDRQFVLDAIQQDCLAALKFADAELKKDKQVVLAAVQQDCLAALKFADAELKKDTEIVRAALQQNWHALQFADNKLKQDKELVLEAVRQDGRALEFADVKLRKDKRFVLTAVQQDGRALEFAHATLKKDKKVVLDAVNQDRSALEFADEKLKEDQKFVQAAEAAGVTL